MSSDEGKSWTHDRILAQAGDGALTVLDIGPGVGTYAKLLADVPIERMVGLEVWAPYVTTYHLHDYYDEIIVGDARTTGLPDVDIVIIGDVIEHMTRDEALALWDRCGEHAARAVYLSIPIVHYPQHEIEGNPYETHVVDDWDDAQVRASFAGIGAHWTGTEVGVYERLTR